mgnify:CR=1 FL=1
MAEIVVHGSNMDSRVIIGEDYLSLLKSLDKKKTFVFTDANVYALYKGVMEGFQVYVLPVGEDAKSFDIIQKTLQFLLDKDADRQSFILGFGGGVVCDIAGFTASVFMRGCRFGYIATTLLAQVDASVGGKNGINFSGYKNLVGTINQPEFVVCHPDFMKTLPKRELKCGLAEVLKIALVSDENLFSFLKNNRDKIFQLNANILEKVIYEAIRLKSVVVNADEKERGLRRILNFGHTFGHAIESTSEYNHGEAVSVGMHIALKISVDLGMLDHKEFENITNLQKSYDLPIDCAAKYSDLMRAVTRDKKRDSDSIHFVLIDRVGNAVTQRLSFEQLKAYEQIVC